MKSKPVVILLLGAVASSDAINQEPAVADLRFVRATFATSADGSVFEPEQTWALVSDAQGRFYLVDGKAQTVSLFDKNGRFLKRIGGAGRGPAEFVWPAAAIISRDSLLVWDIAQRRMSWFLLDGTHVRDRLIPAMGNTQRMRMHPDGGVVAQVGPTFKSPPDSLNGLARLIWIDPNTGSQRELARWRDTLANVAAVSSNSSAVAAVPFGPRSSWELTSSGRLLLTHGTQYLVASLPDSPGEKPYSRRYRPVALTSRERDSAAQKVAGYAPALRGQVRLPRTKPAIEDLQLSEDGCLWIKVNGPAQPEGQRWELFDQERQWVSTVLIPTAFRVMHVSATNIYFVTRDSLDLEMVGYIAHSARCVGRR